MDLRIFSPKTPVNLSAQIQRDVMNNDYSGATLTNKEGNKRRYFTSGFSIDELEQLGITDSTQLSQLRSMDDAGSIDLVSFESDPDHIGFILTDDLHNVIQHASEDVGLLKSVAWTIFEIIDPLSETPFEGSLKPLKRSNGTPYRVDFKDLPRYFEHVMDTGELMPDSFMKGEKKMSDEKRPFTNEELQKMNNAKNTGDSNIMDMTIEKKKSEDDKLYDEGEEYYQEKLRRDKEEIRRKEIEARNRRDEDRRQRELASKNTQKVAAKPSTNPNNPIVPAFIPFEKIIEKLKLSPNSHIQRYYMSDLEKLSENVDAMNIDADIFNSFDEQGRRDLMIAMNREREKLVTTAISQLTRDALSVEEQVEVDSEDANASIREKHVELYINPVGERQAEMRAKLDVYTDEREAILARGFDEWWTNVQEDPESAYREMFNSSVVVDAVTKEKERLSEEYLQYKQECKQELDAFISEFIETRKARDINRLELDWKDGSRQGAQALSDRVDTARGQMESRRMINEMRSLHDKMEERMLHTLDEAHHNSKVSSTSRQEGTVQQINPEPRVQAPAAPVAPIERKPVTPTPVPVAPKPEPVKVVEPDPEPIEDDVIDDTYDDVPDATISEPVINRPRDMYPRDAAVSAPAESDWGDDDEIDDIDDNNDWGDEGEIDDEPESDDYDDEWDDEVEDKPRKKGLKALFGKR